MDRYTELRSFVLVAEKGIFAAAALVEQVTPVVMGRRLDALEARLGVRLMHRSTRGLHLTDLGEQYLEQARQLLRDFDEVDASISAGRHTVRGHLVVSAPAAFGRRHVAPHGPGFQALHPDIKLSFNRKRPVTPSPPGSPTSVFVSTPNDVDTNTLQFLLNSASAYACPAVGQ